MQTAYDTWRIRVHKGSGSLLIVLPSRYCKRHHVSAGDVLTLKGDFEDAPPRLFTEKELQSINRRKGQLSND